MASIRTVSFGDANIKWNTGLLFLVKFNHDNIKKIHYSIIRPKMKVKDYSEIRHKAFTIIHDAIINKEIESMSDLINIIMAMRMTVVDSNILDENGYLKVSFIVPNDDKYEKITFNNIIYHINHHCRHMYQFCFVQAKEKYSDVDIAISYTTAQWKDIRGWDGIDTHLEIREVKNKYIPKKKWEDN